MISGIILSIFCGFVVFTTLFLIIMGDEPSFNYNFKAVPIINEGFYYNKIETLKILFIALLYINLICSTIYSFVFIDEHSNDKITLLNINDIGFMAVLIGSPILFILSYYLHQISLRAKYLICKDKEILNEYNQPRKLNRDDFFIKENYIEHCNNYILKLSPKEMGDLWVEAYKREMLEINPNVFLEPKKTDNKILLNFLFSSFLLCLMIFTAFWLINDLQDGLSQALPSYFNKAQF